MAITLVQSRSVSNTSLAFNSALTIGNLILVVAASLDTGGGITFSVADDAIDAYSSLSLVDANPVGGGRAQLFFGAAKAAIAAMVTMTTGAFAPRMAIHEFSGINTADQQNSTTLGTDTSNNQNSGNITTLQASELLFGFTVSVMGGVGNVSISPGAGYTQAEVLGVNFITEYQAVSATGIYSAGTSVVRAGKGSTNSWLCQIASFYQAATSVSDDFMFGGRQHSTRLILPGMGN